MAGDHSLFFLLQVSISLHCRLDVVAFPFIGGTVPEGHQGQSIQGGGVSVRTSFVLMNFVNIHNTYECNPFYSSS